MVAHFNTWKSLRALEGREPVKSIAHDMSKFPAGILPINGWLSQIRCPPQLLHNCVIRKNVPTTYFLISM